MIGPVIGPVIGLSDPIGLWVVQVSTTIVPVWPLRAVLITLPEDSSSPTG
jgi:hypothetical protein